ncbi:isocitrate/isopropylmalate family dehydrogenase [Pantoea sp. Mhis]|uniref:isocitrate/isopropylmalate family dehydrogenase n=1 Tax=Pantoea sp. Mhis TaxID=2576759 RepID=UPI001357AA21|nr:isocitrate/isopropylmalate family dehydrogenase [Pantoea sp. Mhis]MXP56485.1 hypothetical protein [Pantoea sp. Mhis]
MPGNDIGSEVMKQTIKVQDLIYVCFNININGNKYDIVCIAINNYEKALPTAPITEAEHTDVILLGSIAAHQEENQSLDKQSERADLLKLRKHFNLFTNLPSAKIYK